MARENKDHWGLKKSIVNSNKTTIAHRPENGLFFLPHASTVNNHMWRETVNGPKMWCLCHLFWARKITQIVWAFNSYFWTNEDFRIWDFFSPVESIANGWRSYVTQYGCSSLIWILSFHVLKLSSSIFFKREERYHLKIYTPHIFQNSVK